MPRYSEKLLILYDLQKGLMVRTSGIRKMLTEIVTRPKCLDEPDLAKIRKTFERSFPEIPAIERVQGFDKFQETAARTVRELEYIYNHFAEIVEWKTEAHQALLESVNDIIEFKFDRNPGLIRAVMQLLVGYVKLMLYWSQIADHKVMLALFCRAYTIAGAPGVTKDLGLIGPFCANFTEPMRHLIEEFAPISMQVGHLLESLHPWMTEILSPTTLRNSDAFNPLGAPDKLALPSYKKIYTDLLYGDRFVDWVLYGFLVCPTELVSPAGLAVFRLAAEQGYILHVYDDITLVFHDEIENLLSHFPAKGQPQFPKDVKKPKLAMELCKTAVQLSGKQHQQMRAFLRERMTVLLRLLEEFPGLTAPKLPMVLAGMSRVRSELTWYVLHQNQMPPKKRHKHFHLSDYTESDGAVGALLFVLDELVHLVRRNAQLIKEYYMEYLRGAHCADLERVVAATVSGHEGRLTHTMIQVLQGFTAQIQARQAGNVQDGDFAALRLNWARLSEGLTSSQSQAFKTPGLADIFARLNTVAEHSRFVDDLEGLLAEFGEMHRVFAFQNVWDTMFQQALAGPGDHPRFASAFVRLTAHGLNNIHRMCPEQRDAVGEDCTRRAAGYLNVIAHRLSDSIQPMCDRLEELGKACGSMEAAFRLQRAQVAKKQNRVPLLEALPGSESSPWGRNSIYMLISTDLSISHLCWSMARLGDVFIYETCFSPTEWIREKLSNTFRSWVRDLVRGGADAGGMQPPSMLLARLHHYIAAMQRATQHIHVDVNKLVRSVLYQETYSRDLSVAGVPTPPSDQSGLGESFLKHMCDWYMLLCDNISPLGSMPPGVVYSPFKRGFVCVPGVAPRGALAAEFFADEQEMGALAELLGPAGVRVVEAAVLLRVQARCHHIKMFLQQAAPILRDFSGALSTRDPHAWAKEAHRLGGGSTALAQHLIGVGVLLAFRKSLKASLLRVQRLRAPRMSVLLESCQSLWEENTFSSPALLQLDCLANDVGLPVGAADQSLKAALAPLKAAREDAGTWDMLPYAVAAVMYDAGAMWIRSGYLESVDAFASNEHLLMPAAQALIFVFQSIQVQASAAAMEPQLSIAQAIKNMVTASATVLLRMKARQRENAFKDLPLRAMLVNLEKFVGECPYVTANVLQQIVPYEMLHGAYVDIGLGRYRGAEEGQSVNAAIATAESNVTDQPAEGAGES